MMVPVRCFTCGAVVANKYEPYIARTEAGEDPAFVLDDLGLPRYCCRRMLLTHVDTVEEAMQYHV